MEFRAQENEMRTSSGPLSYTQLSKEGGERRSRSVNASHHNHHHNGSTTNINCTTQTLDNNYPPRPNVQHHPQTLLHGSRDPDPADRVTTTVPGTTTFSPGASAAKSSSKTTPSSAIRYRECLKNHAASSGGNVFDGCCEFMPSGEEGSLEALKCAACQCHRNFHRKEIDGESHQLYSPSSRRSSSTNTTPTLMLNPLQLPPPLPSPSSLHHHHHHHHHKYFNGPPIIQPMNVAYGGGGGGTESSSEDLNVYGSTEAVTAVPPPPFSLSKKRFRTKFTQEQKDKMLEFADKVGWRFQKQDEEEVERFCAEIGIKRQVLKVWMHNNKSAMKNKQQENINMVMNNNNMSSNDIHQPIDEVSHDHDEPVEEGGLDT